MFQPTAKIIADSVNPSGDRLTTFVLTYHRMIHSEFMTHRMLSKNSSSCLHGDTMITTDMPSGVNRGKKRSVKYSIRELYQKWNKGDSKGRCMKSRLKSLSIRCLNEETLEYTHTSLVDVMYSGVKDVFKITLANGYSLICSKEHRLFTDQGWQTLESLGLEFCDGFLNFPNINVLLATNGFELSVDWLLSEHSQGKTLTNIASEYNLKEKALRWFAKKNKISFKKIVETPDESFEYLDRDWLLTQKEKGLCNSRIAELCNTTEDRVKKSCKKLGITGFVGKELKGGRRRIPWNTGMQYKQSPEAVARMKESAKLRSGENNSRWKGGWQNYADKKAAVAKWSRDVRNEILKKWDYKCAITGEKENLELHHIDPRWHNESLIFEKDNLIVLSKKVHKKIHSNHLELELLDYFNSGKPLNLFFDVCSKKVDPKSISKPIAPNDSAKLVCRFYAISSVEYVGKEDVYDIEVSEPWHNFVADGFVVHNSRAIPVEKMIAKVIDDNVFPLEFGKNQKGMTAKESVDDDAIAASMKIWQKARLDAIDHAWALHKQGVHKQVVNRILEPFSTITVICSGTEYQNFFNQRCHPDAQPEIQALANAMKSAYDESEPKLIKPDDPIPWHIPYLGMEDLELWSINELSLKDLIKISIGRCARVSYLNHDGRRNIQDDIKLHDRLLASNPPHLSPFEHVAITMPDSAKYANFTGFQGYRNILEESLKC